MYFERVKLMEDTILSETTKFLSTIMLPFKTDNPLCFRLLEEVRTFIKDLKSPKQDLEMLMGRFNLSKEVPRPRADCAEAFCGRAIELTNAMTASLRRTRSYAYLASTSRNTKITSSSWSLSSEDAATAEISKNGCLMVSARRIARINKSMWR